MPLKIDQAVQDAVHRAITDAQIDEGKRGAFITVVDSTGIHAILAYRSSPDSHWSIRAGFTHEWAGGDGAEAEVKATW